MKITVNQLKKLIREAMVVKGREQVKAGNVTFQLADMQGHYTAKVDGRELLLWQDEDNKWGALWDDTPHANRQKSIVYGKTPEEAVNTAKANAPQARANEGVVTLSRLRRLVREAITDRAQQDEMYRLACDAVHQLVGDHVYDKLITPAEPTDESNVYDITVMADRRSGHDTTYTVRKLPDGQFELVD